jgi:asparagine synthase (glutamine-hydrolysing)
MCGITGIMVFKEDGKQYLPKIDAATDCLIARGPDGKGIYTHNQVALGHRRLSIIDTTSAAAQPFTDASGRYTIVFNGEIFNYKELRKQLENKGIQFRSASDTEVLLYLYIFEKEKCLQQLNGEFVFAIYDSKDEEFFIARDRFGIKPLYYYQDETKFIFASEMKAIMAFDIPKKIDSASLQLYLHLNYIPSPYSIFENVYKLNPATFLTVNKVGQVTKNSYYSISISIVTVDYATAQNKLKKLLEESVQQRMIADVPIGCFLSGGIDSSIITAIAAEQKNNLNTFSIGYKDEPLFDETCYALLVAKKYHTNHHVFQLTNNDLFACLHEVLDYIDEPFADSSALALNILSMHTKKHVKVALSGDGADELFAGYNKHAAELKVRENGFKANLVKSSLPLLKKLPKSRNSKTGNKIRQLQKFAEGMNLSAPERYWQWAGFTTIAEADNLLLKPIIAYEDIKKELIKNINDDYHTTLLKDVKMVLEGDMLVKVDRMSMSRSLEVRVPFLDHKIVDFAFSLPLHYKIDNGQRKKILKDTFKNTIPDELYHRKKQGFEVPLLKWFKTDLKSMITDDLLSDQFIESQNLFDLQKIKNCKAQLFSKTPNDAVAKIWALIVFQYWYKKTFSI